MKKQSVSKKRNEGILCKDDPGEGLDLNGTYIPLVAMEMDRVQYERRYRRERAYEKTLYI